MFSINIYLRFALIAVFLIGGAVLWAFVNIWTGLPLILIALVLLVGYILLGTVQSASMKMQKGDIIGAEKLLGLTFKPEWLYSSNRAIYYIVKGTIASQNREVKDAETWFKKAENIKLATPQERVMVHMQLAAVYTAQRRWTTAKFHLKKAKEDKIDQPEIKDQLRHLEQIIKSKGQQGVASTQMRRAKGGNRFHR